MNRRSGSSMAVLRLSRGALVGALYTALTFIVLPVSSGAIQFRISEALCILPIFMPEAIAGLFVGCILSNILAGCAVWDIIFGSLATLIGALGCFMLRRLPKRWMWLSTLPTVIANALIVPPILIYAYGSTEAFGFLVVTVALGEIVCAGIGGSALYYILSKTSILH